MAGIRLKLWHVFWQELRGLAATVVLPADDRAEPSCGDTNVHVALFSRGDAGSTLLAVNGAALAGALLARFYWGSSP